MGMPDFDGFLLGGLLIAIVSFVLGVLTQKAKKLSVIIVVAIMIVVVVAALSIFAAYHYGWESSILHINPSPITSSQPPESEEEGSILKSETIPETESIQEESADTAEQAVTDDRAIAEILKEAEKLAKAEDYEGAIEILTAGLADFPESDDLHNKVDEYSIARTAQIKEKTLKAAQNFADSGDYVSAIAVIKKAQETHGNNADYQIALKNYNSVYRAEVIAKADKLAENGDYLSAFEMLEVAKKEVGDDDNVLSVKAAEYENCYVTNAVAKIDKLIAAYEYDSAETALNDAIKAFPNNQTLIEEKTVLERSSHVEYLFDSAPYLVENVYLCMRNNDFNTLIDDEKGYYYDSDYKMSSCGVTYLKGMSITPHADSIAEIYYNLDGQYSTLFGKIAFEDLRSDRIDKKYTISFYGDDKLIDSYTIEKGDLPCEISLNLNKCKKFLIALIKPSDDSSKNPNINLLEFGLKY